MDPGFWGPGIWRYLHLTAAVAFTPQQREKFVIFVKALAETIPCEKCKTHFIKNLNGNYQIREYMTSNETLFMWTYLMHDAVNASQGKTGKDRPTFEHVYREYFDVGDDSGAVDFKEGYQDPICHDVCNGQTVPQPHQRMREENTRNSNNRMQKGENEKTKSEFSANKSGNKKFVTYKANVY